MKKIYEIPAAYEDLYEAFCNEEITETQFDEAVDALGEDLMANVEGFCKVIKTALAEADAAKTEKDRLDTYEKTRRNKAKRLMSYVKHHMDVLGVKKVPAGLFVAAIHKNSQPSVVISDEAKLPEKYLVPQPPRPNKGMILDDWKAGEFDGDGNVSVVVGNHLRIK
jgi:hypothetical protein